ncbi:hypothetical protein B7C51_16505 [Paenibacillus larvae subsp. pulvifaciens]|uniref:Uncharacterized protein n=1 Tax=Paenibacillus larvae subsp. pulvifaciens TaxID=1477 RepID=A0A1V0UVA2_9BACL|nr:hypothetical protein [Paenibacillus larvae]ARF69066.1 hypothetical protein B7C51_16505 [Paenibacillus larvae subsp. pulvifaciens]MCY9510932.1 hypothetical protein [Paenibacillus larvae]MCY9526277.1 hypothetical protein [Paenibacillus larvae]
MKITTTEHFELFPNASEANREVAKDTERIDTIIQTKDNRYIVNGKELSKEELKRPISSVATLDSGGAPAVCHYYDRSDYINYHFGCYSGVNIYSKPTGSHIQKNASIYSGPYVQRAMSAIDIFGADISSMDNARSAFIVAAGVAAVTWETVIGLIAAGGAAGAAAVAFFNAYNGASSDLAKAYNYVKLI